MAKTERVCQLCTADKYDRSTGQHHCNTTVELSKKGPQGTPKPLSPVTPNGDNSTQEYNFA